MKENVTIPTDLLVRLAKDNREEQAYWLEHDNVAMANWHEGRAIAIETLIDVWARD